MLAKNAKNIEIKSLIKNGADTSRNDVVIFIFIKILYCTIPKIWHINKLNIISKIFPNLFLILFDKPHKITIGINPIINPPVTPNTVERPLEKLENTGSPQIPNNMYERITKLPFL